MTTREAQAVRLESLAVGVPLDITVHNDGSATASIQDDRADIPADGDLHAAVLELAEAWVDYLENDVDRTELRASSIEEVDEQLLAARRFAEALKA